MSHREVRPYEPDDLRGLYRPGDRVAAAHSVLMQHGSFVRTIEYNHEVIAVLGMVVRYPGVADCWAVIGDSARGRGVFLTKVSRALMHQFAQELDLHRVGVLVRADMPEYGRWAKAMGFEFESVEVQGAPDGTDIHRYRWLRWTKVPHSKLQ